MAALPLALFAETPPALLLSDGVGDMVLIDSSGAPPTCTAVCTTVAYSVTAGTITWKGVLGPFGTVANPIVVVGQSKPVLGPEPFEDLSVTANTTTAGGTLTAQWSDTNFTLPGATGGMLTVGGLVTQGTATTMA
jgi:hypothetical protein